jgi:hypothetical protein
MTDIKEYETAKIQMETRIKQGEVELEINRVVLAFVTDKIKHLEKDIKKEVSKGCGKEFVFDDVDCECGETIDDEDCIPHLMLCPSCKSKVRK